MPNKVVRTLRVRWKQFSRPPGILCPLGPLWHRVYFIHPVLRSRTRRVRTTLAPRVLHATTCFHFRTRRVPTTLHADHFFTRHSSPIHGGEVPSSS